MQFLQLTDGLLGEGKTTGLNQTQSLLAFTQLNRKRMERLNKTTILKPDLVHVLQQIAEKQTWLVITEAWCGDSAQNLPIINKMANENSKKIDFKIIVRDDHLDVMDKYLTNGSRSIPKLISTNEKGEDIFVWGPRPQLAQELLLKWKKNPEGKSWEAFEVELHTWYARNKADAIQNEFVQLLS